MDRRQFLATTGAGLVGFATAQKLSAQVAQTPHNFDISSLFKEIQKGHEWRHLIHKNRQLNEDRVVKIWADKGQYLDVLIAATIHNGTISDDHEKPGFLTKRLVMLMSQQFEALNGGRAYMRYLLVDKELKLKLPDEVIDINTTQVSIYGAQIIPYDFSKYEGFKFGRGRKLGMCIGLSNQGLFQSEGFPAAMTDYVLGGVA